MGATLDIVNSIAFFQIVFFTVFLFYKGSDSESSKFLKFFLLTEAAAYITYFILGNDLIFLYPLRIITQPCILLWAPAFHFYIRSKLYSNIRMDKRFFKHCIPAVVMMLWSAAAIFKVPWFYETRLEVAKFFQYLMMVQLLVYSAASIYDLKKYNRQIREVSASSQNTKLAWLKAIAYSFYAMVLINSISLIYPGPEYEGVRFVFFWLFLNVFFFKAIIQPDQFLGLEYGEPERQPKQVNPEQLEFIHNLVDSQKLYLLPDLSLADVAKQLNLPERQVSSVINGSGQNFCDFINRKRIAYAQQKLSEPEQKMNILEILYDSGFNSKSVFNTQFKKLTGLSPKEFRKRQLEDTLKNKNGS